MWWDQDHIIHIWKIYAHLQMLIRNVQCHSNPKETTGELVFTNHIPYMMYNCLWYKGPWLTQEIKQFFLLILYKWT
jgi:hypothetical protein